MPTVPDLARLTQLRDLAEQARGKTGPDLAPILADVYRTVDPTWLPAANLTMLFRLVIDGGFFALWWLLHTPDSRPCIYCIGNVDRGVERIRAAEPDFDQCVWHLSGVVARGDVDIRGDVATETAWAEVHA